MKPYESPREEEEKKHQPRITQFFSRPREAKLDEKIGSKETKLAANQGSVEEELG
jgi:hypothetical protein